MFQNITSLDDYTHNMGLTAEAKKRMEEKAFSINLIERARELKSTWTTEDYVRLNVNNGYESDDEEFERICRKLNQGFMLTDEEADYLKHGHQAKYKEALEILSERKRYELKLAELRYKEEVREEKLRTSGEWLKKAEGINNNPYLEAGLKMQMLFKITVISNHITNAYYSFLESEDYKRLPFRDEFESKEQILYENKKAEHAVAEEAEDKVTGTVNTKGTNMYRETSRMDYDMEVERLKNSFFGKA